MSKCRQQITTKNPGKGAVSLDVSSCLPSPGTKYSPYRVMGSSFCACSSPSVIAVLVSTA